MDNEWIPVPDAADRAGYAEGHIKRLMQRGIVAHELRPNRGTRSIAYVRLADVIRWRDRLVQKPRKVPTRTDHARQWIRANRELFVCLPHHGLSKLLERFTQETGVPMGFEHWRFIVRKMGLSWKKGQGRG